MKIYGMRFILTGISICLIGVVSLYGSISIEDYNRVGRILLAEDKQAIVLQPRGGVFLKESKTEGFFRCTFSVAKPENFRWFAPEIILYSDRAVEPVVNGYILRIMSSGVVHFLHVVNGERKEISRFIIPGRDNPNALYEGKSVIFTVTPDLDQGVIAVFCGSRNIDGDPDFRFRIDPALASGYFGVINRGSNSLVLVESLKHTTSR